VGACVCVCVGWYACVCVGLQTCTKSVSIHVFVCVCVFISIYGLCQNAIRYMLMGECTYVCLFVRGYVWVYMHVHDLYLSVNAE